jgi:NhaA family Na+:H+ antiporter
MKNALTALAVFDDVGAVLVIALFYGHGIAFEPLMIAGVAVLGLAFVHRWQWTNPMPYIALGTVLWAAMSKAGVEPALAGLVIGAAVPLRAPEASCRSPLRTVERSLHPYATLLIVPLFGFFNAGIDLRAVSLEAVPWRAILGIALGLFLGKQLGIMVTSWAVVHLGLAKLPCGVGWRQVYGAALLAGIGFTMSLFVASLAFVEPGIAAAARMGILAGSIASAIFGSLVIAKGRNTEGIGAKHATGSSRQGWARRTDRTLC